MRYIIGTFLFGFLILPVIVQSQDSINVEEIIVTATKTEKTLQEVPVAVSVVTADTIEKANIIDILEALEMVTTIRVLSRLLQFSLMVFIVLKCNHKSLIFP